MAEQFSEEELKELLQSYARLFVVSRRAQWLYMHKRVKGKKSWYPLRGKLKFKHLCEHINEVKVYGVKFTDFTNAIAIDCDCHQVHREEVKRLAKMVLLALGGEPIIVQSSESRGIHLWYFFKERYKAGVLKGHFTRSLKRGGLAPKEGIPELKCGSNATLRLPLGKGSHLLDRNFNRLSKNKREDLERLPGLLHLHTLSDISPTRRREVALDEALSTTNIGRCNSTNLAISKPNNAHNSRANSNLSPSNNTVYQNQHEGVGKRTNVPKEARKLLKQGLTQIGTRHLSLWTLAVYFVSHKRLDKEETVRRLRRWIDDHHNRKSKDYNRNPQEVYLDIERIVEHVYKKTDFSISPKAVGLTPSEVAYILRNPDLSFEEQRFLFKIVRRAKYQGTPLNETTRLITLPQSWMVSPKVKISSRGSYQKRLNKLCNLGILERRREYSTSQRRARSYVVKYPFQEGGDIKAFDEKTICLFLTKDEVKNRKGYTQYRVRKIFEKGNPVDKPKYRDVPIEIPDTDTRPDVIGFDSDGKEIQRPFWDRDGIREFWEECLRVNQERMRRGTKPEEE